MNDQSTAAGQLGSGANPDREPNKAAGTGGQQRRPFWRRLIRGILFLPTGVPPLLFFTWLLDGIGLAIGVLVMCGAFVQGYTGQVLFGGTQAVVAAADTATVSAPADTPPPGRRRGRLWWTIPVTLVAILSALAIVLAIVGPLPTTTVSDATLENQTAAKAVIQPAPKKPETLEDRVGEGNMERVGDWIIIRHKPGTVWSAKSYVVEAGQLLERVGRWASADVPGRIGAKKIILQVWPTVTDRYGNEARSMVLALEFDPAEFAKINWSNFSATDMLNVVEIAQLWPSMVPGVVAYCKDRGVAARHFCQQAARFIR